MNTLHYSMIGDFQFPNLISEVSTNTVLGKYGRMRKRYLREYRPVLWNGLRMSGQLYSHLQDVDNAANRILEQMLPTLMHAAGVTETLKAADPLRWTGLVNTCKAQAEEVILIKLIYS